MKFFLHWSHKTGCWNSRIFVIFTDNFIFSIFSQLGSANGTYLLMNLVFYRAFCFRPFPIALNQNLRWIMKHILSSYTFYPAIGGEPNVLGLCCLTRASQKCRSTYFQLSRKEGSEHFSSLPLSSESVATLHCVTWEISPSVANRTTLHVALYELLMLKLLCCQTMVSN